MGLATTTTEVAWLGRGKPQIENARRVGRIRPERDYLGLGIVFRVSCTVSMSSAQEESEQCCVTDTIVEFYKGRRPEQSPSSVVVVE
jgi:hypothetical protein